MVALHLRSRLLFEVRGDFRGDVVVAALPAVENLDLLEVLVQRLESELELGDGLEGAVGFAVELDPFFVLVLAELRVADAVELDVVVAWVGGAEARGDLDEDVVVGGDAVPGEAGVGRALVDTLDLYDEVVVAGRLRVAVGVVAVAVLAHF